MTKNEIVEKAAYLQEIEGFIDELKAEAETIKDSIKAEMLERDVTEIQAGKYIIRWSDVISNKFDSTSFKKTYGELYKAFTKQVMSKRFSIV